MVHPVSNLPVGHRGECALKYQIAVTLSPPPFIPFPVSPVPFLSLWSKVQHLHLATEIIFFIDPLTLGTWTSSSISSYNWVLLWARDSGEETLQTWHVNCSEGSKRALNPLLPLLANLSATQKTEQLHCVSKDIQDGPSGRRRGDGLEEIDLWPRCHMTKLWSQGSATALQKVGRRRGKRKQCVYAHK